MEGLLLIVNSMVNKETAILDRTFAALADPTRRALLARLETFLQNPETLFRAAENARSCGKPDAARKLGNIVMAIASGWDNHPQG